MCQPHTVARVQTFIQGCTASVTVAAKEILLGPAGLVFIRHYFIFIVVKTRRKNARLRCGGDDKNWAHTNK